MGHPIAIEVRNVSKRYSDDPGLAPALDNVSVDIADNEFFTLLGPSGCGKTTLLRTIAGYEHVSDGEIRLAGEPVIAHSIFQSITWLRQAMFTLRVNCVDGITANRERLGAMVGSSVGVITALTPFIGYAAAAALAKAALLTGRGVADLVVEAGLMSRDEVAKQLSPARLSGLETVTAAIPIVVAPEDVVEEAPADTR